MEYYRRTIVLRFCASKKKSLYSQTDATKSSISHYVNFSNYCNNDTYQIYSSEEYNYSCGQRYIFMFLILNFSFFSAIYFLIELTIEQIPYIIFSRF